MDTPTSQHVCAVCGKAHADQASCPHCAGPDAAKEERRQRLLDRTELAIAILLGIAAILTAWSAFQSAELGGTVTTAYSQGIRLSDEASQAYNESTASDIADEALFLEFAKATNENDEATAAYIHDSLMSEDLAAAVDWWAEQPESAGFDTPFVEENPAWSTEAIDAAADLDTQAQRQFELAKRSDETGGSFDVLSIIIAIALFLFGVASLVRQERIKIGLGVVGGAILLFSILRLLSLGNPAGVGLGTFF